VLAIGLLTFVASGFLFGKVGKEFVSSEDRGAFLITFEAPEGSSIEYTDRYVRQIEALLAKEPEVRSCLAVVGLSFGGPSSVNNGLFIVLLADRDQRRHQDLILNDLRGKLAQVTGVVAYPVTFNPLARSASGRTFEYILQNPDFNALATGSQAFAERLKQLPGFVDVDTDLKLNKPEIKITIDRDRAAALGVGVSDIAMTLNVLLAGNNFTKFKARGERYDVMVQLLRADRLTPEILDRVSLRAEDGRLVRLGNVVRVEEGVGASVINRYGRLRSVKILASLAVGLTLDDAVKRADALAQATLPAGFTTRVSGQAREMKESAASLQLALLLAIVLIFLVLAAQFEHWLYPISVMGALPLSTLGAVGTLLLFGMTVNIYSMIGIIMLMGLVTKNSILLVDYTNTLRSRGLTRDDALAESGRVRLRPILMTSVATIFGILPIALGLGAGAEARRPLGAAVVGGMITSTLLTLFVVPVLYSVLDGLSRRVMRLRRARTPAQV